MMKKKCLSIMLSALVLLLGSGGSAFADGWWHKHAKDQSVTNWFVIVNYPEACSGTPCSEADIFGQAPDANPTKATVCFVTGQIVQKNGKATFSGAVGEGDSSQCFFPGDADAHALKDSMRAEIHVIVQIHGEPLPMGYGLEEQLTYAGGGCNPLPENCADVQFSIHLASDADDTGRSSSTVNRFDDGTPIHGAESVLIRDREGVRSILQTKLDKLY